MCVHHIAHMFLLIYKIIQSIYYVPGTVLSDMPLLFIILLHFCHNPINAVFPYFIASKTSLTVKSAITLYMYC